MVRSLALSHNGTLLAVGGIFGGQIEVWDVKTHDKLSAIPSGHSKSISHLTFNGDDSLLASGAKDRTVEIWDMTAGKQFLKLEGTPGNVVKFSPDSRLLAVGHGQNGTLSLWRVADGSPVETFKKTAATYLYSIDFTPDGQLLASGQDSGTVKLWSVETLEEQHTLHKVSETHWESTGGIFEAQADTNGIAIWDRQASQELGRVPLPDTSGAEMIITSQDGNWRASVAYGEPITLQNRSTNPHTLLDKHVNTINSVQFSPDNLLLASGSTDRTIRLWNLQEGREVAVLHGHADGVTSVNFSTDGTKLFSLSDDGTIKIWELDLDAIIQQGCNWIQGYLHNNPNVNAEDREICSHS
jgi:WD40 repeat protein